MESIDNKITEEKEVENNEKSVDEISNNKEVDKTQNEKETVSKKDKAKKGGKTAFVVTFALVMSIILCIWVISQVLSNGYISVGGYSLFRVASGSMEPEMPVGTLLISKETDIKDIEIKDIVNFRSKDAGMVGMVITHRVTGIYKDVDGSVLLETKGDANSSVDARPVDSENLIGKVVYFTGEGNFFANLISFLTSKIGFWAFIVFPCILVGMGIMRDTIRSLKTEMDAIHKELDEMSEVVNKKESKSEKAEESYEEMYERLRRELLEELNQSAEQVETEKESNEK